MNKSKGGRPSRYKPEFAVVAERMCKLGATDKDLHQAFQVTEKTLNNWKKVHPEFLQALKAGKLSADEQVEQSLFNRAMGYNCPETKVFCNDGEIITQEVTKHYPPDPTSMIFWLKNRRPDLWRDKQEFAHTGTVSVEHSGITEQDKMLIRELRQRQQDAHTTH